LSLYRRDLLLAKDGLRDGFDGSQDYDLLLRYTCDLGRDEILHLPYPGYLWRRHKHTYSSKFLDMATANARKALAEAYCQSGRVAPVESAAGRDLHRVRFDLARSTWPLVSVVIPNRNAMPLISRVLSDLMTATDYPSLEIIVVDNGTTDPDVLALYEQYRVGRIPFRAEVQHESFNFSRSVNKGLAVARGQHVLLLNNDVEVLEPGWLKEMVACFDYEDVGIVGAKLLYPDRTIQHAGVIAGLGGLAGHWFTGMAEDFPGPMGRLWVRQSFSVLTGACMLISQDCAKAVGPFDENIFPIAYNDVDFCLRAAHSGYRVVWTPFATLVHHESASRGSDETPENALRFARDKDSLRERHKTVEFQDRTFNPWYSRDGSSLEPVFLESLPSAR
jgi:GT2 family glycosyltransferase